MAEERFPPFWNRKLSWPNWPAQKRLRDSTPRKKTSARQIEDIVRRMARMHFETEEFIERIIWFKSANEEEIHLIDVNRDTIPTDSVMTFYFRESKQFPLPVIIADVTSEEWEKIFAGKIPLPKGYSLENAVELERDEVLAYRG